ncbi:MAG TPA: amidase family protein, partial [Acidimicrobiia bacterium]|nr:amidase family protein [Acidimicrobiia bacterium]
MPIIDADRPMAFAPAVALLGALRAREVSARELLDLYLARIGSLEPGIGAVVTLDAERAMAAAAAADDARAAGDDRPLLGLPVTVKDSLETAGLRTTAGARELSGYVPGGDAAAVARLRAAGAVVVGKTNLPAWASDVQSSNEVFGTTVNPYDRSRTPGGSSGGSAAALAAGLTGLELGSDIGGSIRTPATWCGVFGHKPTYGIVPTRGHVP